MKQPAGTKQEWIKEISTLKQRIQELEQSELKRKRAEKLLRALSLRQEAILAAVPDIIMEVDNNKVYTWANAAGIDFFGKDVIGKQAAFYFEGEQETYDKVSPLFGDAEDIIYVESWQRRRDGEKRLLGWWCRVLKDENGQITGALSSARDITTRKQIEDELRRNQDVAERLAQEMAIIAEIGLVIGSTMHIDEVYERFATETQKLILIDSLTVNLYNFQENTMHVAYVSGLNIDGRRQGDSLVLDGSLSEAVIRGRTSIRIQPASIDELVGEFPRLSPIFQAGLRSIMCVPLISRDEVIGVLHFRSKKPNAYTDQDLRLAERIGMQIAGAMANAQMLNDLSKTEKSLRKSEEQYRTLVENASDIVFRTNDTGHFTFVNPATLRITGYEEKDLIGRHYPTVIHRDMLDETMKFFRRQFVKGIQNKYFEYAIITNDGRKVWLGQNTQLISENGHVVGFQAVARDIMESKRKEAEILSLSITDPLTGLHNRRGFLSLAGQQLKLAERNKIEMLLFFADLDGLKWINDTLGHEEGDKALIEAATVLKETFRSSDIIARLGGDEYAALAVEITEENSEIITGRLRSLIDTRNNKENRRYKLSISVGCSCYDPEHPCSLDELIAHADQLMYEQKQKKKSLHSQGDSLSNSIH